MSDKPQTEIEVGKDGVKLRGVYEDFRPAVQTAVATVNHVLSIAEQITGLSADFVHRYLGKFRERYRERIEAVPEEFRELPPVRLGCIVLREAAFAADETELQEMFAELLASASDMRSTEKIHPSFATAITQMGWFDSQILVQVWAKGRGQPKVPLSSISACFQNETSWTAPTLDNLVRLGLLRWEYPGSKGLSSTSAARDFSREFRKRSGGEFGQAINFDSGLTAASEALTASIVDQFQKATKPDGVSLTEYGRLFINACVPRSVKTCAKMAAANVGESATE